MSQLSLSKDDAETNNGDGQVEDSNEDVNKENIQENGKRVSFNYF